MVNRIAIRASARRIYAVASSTDRWPTLLPHYRFVRVLSSDGDERTVEMGASRGMIPIRWIAVQRNDPLVPSIYFHHIGGWTKGMNVVWRFEEGAAETIVSIRHELDFAFPVAAAYIEKRIIAGYFINGVATMTLERIKQLLEKPVHV